jgi:hypothetical protein
MEKEFVLRAWRLIQDAMNPNNSTIVHFAIEDLFTRIELDEMNTLQDYIAFKDEWYPQMKNR